MRAPDFIMTGCASAGVEAVIARTRRSLARHTHEQYGIGAIDSGAHRSHSGRGQVEAGAGDSITVNPGEVHDGAPIGDKGRSWRILYFAPAVVQAAAQDVLGAQPGRFEFSQPVIGDRRVTDVFRALFAAETGMAEATRREELLLALIALSGGCRAISVQRPPPEIRKAKRCIDDDPSVPFTLARLAEISAISRFQLLRGFVRATGFTPHAYIVQRRVDFARRLIAGGEALAGAAAAAGFADQSHMTRIFVRKYGFSPGVYATALGCRAQPEAGRRTAWFDPCRGRQD